MSRRCDRKRKHRKRSRHSSWHSDHLSSRHGFDEDERDSRNFTPGGGRWYRIPSEGHLAGICAGLADYYNISTLMARGIAVTAGLFMPQVVVICYVVGIFYLPTRKEARDAQEEREQSILDEIEAREKRSRRRGREFQEAYETITNIDDPNDGSERRRGANSLDSKRILIRRFKERMRQLEGRLQNLERHVTSKRFDLAREIDRL